MTAGTQCDNCRKFGPSHAPGWFYVAQQPTDDDYPASLTAALFGRPAEPATFCGIRCLAEWAYAHAVTEGTATGKEPG